MARREDMTPEDRAERNRKNRAARNKYNEKAYEKVMIRIRTDGSDEVSAEAIKAAASRDGMSVNAWILDAIRDKL